MRRALFTWIALAAGVAGCTGALGDPGVDQGGTGLGSPVGAGGSDSTGNGSGGSGASNPGDGEFSPPPPTIHRISSSQYGNAARVLFGEPIALPEVPGEDLSKYGFTTVDLATRSISRLELEQYEAAAYALVDQVWADPARRESLVGCTPAAVGDACVRTFLETFGRRAWRRSLTSQELDVLVDLGQRNAQNLGDVWLGLRYTLAAILLSPHFLWRVEVGEADAATGLTRFTSLEMASRLSFLIWDGLPDETLIDLGESGAFDDVERVREHARAMVDDPRARPALTKFFREFMLLVNIDGELSKDTEQFPQFTETLGRSMRTELEMLFQDVVFDKEGDFRKLLTTRETFVNEELASVYGIDGVSGDEFVSVELPADGRRGGLLTAPGFLANNAAKNAYEAVTSPTHRGRFIRLKLMCMDIAAPPPGVDTTIPPADPGNPTSLRDRLSQHATDPTCAGCHQLMDPIGFGLENYDAIGAYRTMDGSVPVDATTDLDGVAFEGAVSLGELLADMQLVSDCIARNFYSYANGRPDDYYGADERPLGTLVSDFASADYDFKQLVVELVTNEGYRYAGAVGQ